MVAGFGGCAAWLRSAPTGDQAKRTGTERPRRSWLLKQLWRRTQASQLRPWRTAGIEEFVLGVHGAIIRPLGADAPVTAVIVATVWQDDGNAENVDRLTGQQWAQGGCGFRIIVEFDIVIEQVLK